MQPILPEEIATALGAELRYATPLAGGDVALAYLLELDTGRRVFAKTHPDPPPLAFTTEARGLAWLREAGAIGVPEVIGVSDAPPFLALEWIETGQRSGGTEEDFGRSLAKLHATGASCFGREDRRCTGSRGIPNEPCENWEEFYASQRLVPLARLAKDEHALPSSSVSALEDVASRLERFAPDPEPPSRLHGDLWSGNRLVDVDGRNWLIDPAAHGGHREFDLAMMQLFGGFGEDCYHAYAEYSPLAPGYGERVALHQLAPLVVHAIKFGGGYVGAVAAALEPYR